MEHTKGPWNRVDISTNTTTRKEQLCHNGYAAMQLHYDESEEGEANAQLIAAAPDLLRAAELALQDLIELCVKAGHDIETTLSFSELKAAIAKAEGRE